MSQQDDNKEPVSEKPEPKGTKFCLAMSGFILLWLSAMQYLSLFDAGVIFVIILCTSIGRLKGGVRELFHFFGIVASFLFAINAYQALYAFTKFSFWTGDEFWGKAGWFLLLLGTTWTMCRVMALYLERTVAKIAPLQTVNRVLGMVLGGLKGIILGYIFIIVVMGTELTKEMGKEFQHSCAHRYVMSLENRHHFLENLVELQVSERVHSFLTRAYNYFTKD